MSKLSQGVLEKSPNGENMYQDWLNKTPIGFIGYPEHLKGIAVYLASNASAYATAADFPVDGGYTAV